MKQKENKRQFSRMCGIKIWISGTIKEMIKSAALELGEHNIRVNCYRTWRYRTYFILRFERFSLSENAEVVVAEVDNEIVGSGYADNAAIRAYEKAGFKSNLVEMRVRIDEENI